MRLLLDIQNLAGSSKTWCAERAQNAMNIQQGVRNGAMTISEGKELLSDLIATDKLDKEADDFALRTQLVNTITTVINFVQSMTSFPGVRL